MSAVMPKWTPLSAPVDPMDTHCRYQAMSILHGLVRDPLPDTAAQARDVLAWHGRAYAAEQSAPDTVISFIDRRGF
ncbi:MAG: hypothetical protein M3R16_09635 [Pseudomonadota bacterium]|nr:hypothetical protein [Pseudomonadota bacterium]